MAAKDFALERWLAARNGFVSAQNEPTTTAEDKARMGFLLGICDRHLGRGDDAAAEFDAAATALPLLVDYASYEAANAYVHLSDYDKATARIARIAPDAVLIAASQLLLGDVLRERSKWPEVATLYRAYIDKHVNGIRFSEARFWLADADEKLNPAKRADTIALYRLITVEDPLSSWNEKAQKRLDALHAPKQLTPAELLTRGLRYFDDMRNELAEADLTAALKAGHLDKDQKCIATYHLAQTVFKERQRPRAAPLFDEAIAACALTTNADLQVRSAYQGGRSWGAAGEQQKTIELFDKAETWHPDHSFADDARLRQAEEWEILEKKGDATATAKVNELLSTIPTKYATGDQKGEALWRLAWRAWKAGQWDQAISWLDQEAASVGHEDNYYAAGQTSYWKARALEKLNRPNDAKAAYATCVREYPLSYYSLLALSRLRESYPPEYSAIVAEIERAPASVPADPFNFKPREIYGTPGFRRGVELLRLGLGEAAERELARAGLKAPEGRTKVTDPDQAELLWATALLNDRAHRYDKSHWIARWSVRDHELVWPNAGNRAKWEIAYPRAFWNIIEPAAKLQGYPADLLIAFVREESAFDPIMESFANAIGLTQMIMPTATRFGKGLGWDINRETLRDPEKNVAVGSRWLAFLWTTFKQDPHLVIAGYNSGEGAIWHWLCQRGDLALDEFEEEIPYDETRNYTKRVMASWFAYSYLDDGSIPAVTNVIPPEAINQKRCK